jgi:hypothetical protein
MGDRAMKAYVITRILGRVGCTVLEIPGEDRELVHVCCHSPDGFEAGYGGSGPADLALSILTDFLGSQEAAWAEHQPFKWAFISGATDDKLPLTIRGEQIRAWLQAQEEKRA